MMHNDVCLVFVTLFVQSYSLKAYKRVAEADIAGLMTGLALDFTMGGSYSPKDFNDIKFDQALKFIFSKTFSLI